MLIYTRVKIDLVFVNRLKHSPYIHFSWKNESGVGSIKINVNSGLVPEVCMEYGKGVSLTQKLELSRAGHCITEQVRFIDSLETFGAFSQMLLSTNV